MVRTPRAASVLTRLRYCSRNWMRPYVPPPTTRKNRPAQMVVMVTPIGEISMDCPGTTKGAADWTADEAAAAALGSTLVGPLAEVENTPLTKDASPDERVVSTS